MEQVGKSMEIFQNLRKAYDIIWVHMGPYKMTRDVKLTKVHKALEVSGGIIFLAGRRFCCAQVSCDNCGLHLADADKPGHSLLDPDLY